MLNQLLSPDLSSRTERLGRETKYVMGNEQFFSPAKLIMVVARIRKKAEDLAGEALRLIQIFRKGYF